MTLKEANEAQNHDVEQPAMSAAPRARCEYWTTVLVRSRSVVRSDGYRKWVEAKREPPCQAAASDLANEERSAPARADAAKQATEAAKRAAEASGSAAVYEQAALAEERAAAESAKQRRTRELEAAAAEQGAEKAGISISNVRLRTDDPATRRASSEKYVEIKIDATIRRKQPGGTELWASIACQVGDKRMVDKQSAMETVWDLNAGETKEIEFLPFINRPLAREPVMCHVIFGTMAIGGGAPGSDPRTIVIRDLCYIPGTSLRAGACPWPTP